jgi:hypothetical protein
MKRIGKMLIGFAMGILMAGLTVAVGVGQVPLPDEASFSDEFQGPPAPQADPSEHGVARFPINTRPE